MKIYNLGSLNIDYVYSVEHFVSAGGTLSSDVLEVFPGGKGLNKSVALARAGAKVIHGGLIIDGGHGMIFKDFGGKLLFTMHYPNTPYGAERAKIMEIEEIPDEPYLKIK